MKRFLFIVAVGLCLANCTGVQTVTTGLVNESFLEFIGQPEDYSGGVKVLIDDRTSFKAEVKKDYAKRPTGKIYGIPTGKHDVKITYKDVVIYQKQIFISSQETRKIHLP